MERAKVRHTPLSTSLHLLRSLFSFLILTDRLELQTTSSFSPQRLLPSSPPADYRPLSTTSTRKIYIPIKEYPDYKFIGLILGPRGSMQKEMERVTGAKIAIRGRGSRPEGRRAHPSGADEDDELHVLLTATSQEALDHAESLVSRLLVPVEEGLNEIKMRQLRKLAEMAGTLRDTNYGLELHFKENRPDGFSRSTPLPSPPRPPQFVTQAYYDLMTTLGEDTNNIQVQESTAHIAHQKDEEGYLSFLSSVGIETSSLGGNAFSSSTAASSPDLELHTEHQLPAPWDL